MLIRFNPDEENFCILLMMNKEIKNFPCIARDVKGIQRIHCIYFVSKKFMEKYFLLQGVMNAVL